MAFFDSFYSMKIRAVVITCVIQNCFFFSSLHCSRREWMISGCSRTDSVIVNECANCVPNARKRKTTQLAGGKREMRGKKKRGDLIYTCTQR